MTDVRQPPPRWAAYLTEMSALGHVAVDRTAALLHGVDAYAWAELDLPQQPETAVSPGRRATRLAAVDGCARALAPQDVTLVGGTPTTTALRTALDLGCRLKRWHAYAAMNALARTTGITPADLAAELPRFRRRRGVCQLRELVGLVEPLAESAMESRVLLAILDAGLPRPVAQFELVTSSGAAYRLDLAYPRLRFAIEYDGTEHHSKLDDRVRDWRRRDDLREVGWTVLVLTAKDFHGTAEDRWLRTVRTELAAAPTNRRW